MFLDSSRFSDNTESKFETLPATNTVNIVHKLGHGFYGYKAI